MPTFFVAEVHEGLFSDPMEVAPPATSGWRFFAPCSDDDIWSCTLLAKDLPSFGVNNQRKLVEFLKYLLQYAKSGQSWAQLFRDGKQFHPVHRFAVERVDLKTGKRTVKEYEVHQFKKKQTELRILFMYADGRLNIFISHAFEKDTPKTEQRQQTRAETTMRAFVEALDSQNVQLISEQGGHNATQGLFG